jgi:hypothetical protein
MLVEAQAARRAGEQAGERGLAHRQRLAPQVVALELDQIEGKQEGAGVMPAIADAVEACESSSPHTTASPSIMQERAQAG